MLIEKGDQCVAVRLVPLSHLVFTGICDKRQLNRFADASHDLSLRTRQQRHPQEAEESHRRDAELVEPQAEVQKTGESEVRVALAESVDGMHTVPVLQRIFDEASSALHHCAVPTVNHGCCILKTTRDETDIPPLGHCVHNALLVQRLNAPMNVAQHLEIRIIVAEHLVDEMQSAGACVLVELLAPNAIDAETDGKNPMRMKTEEGFVFVHIIQSASQFARSVILAKAQAVEKPWEPLPRLELPKPCDEDGEAQPNKSQPKRYKARGRNVMGAHASEDRETGEGPCLAIPLLLQADATKDRERKAVRISSQHDANSSDRDTSQRPKKAQENVHQQTAKPSA